jgi:hypothetical protein
METYSRKIVKGTSPDEDKIIAIFEKLHDGSGKTRVFYGDKQRTFLVAQEKFKSMTSKPRTSPYILIKYDKREYESLIVQCKKKQYI